MNNPFKSPAKGSSFKPNTKKTLSHKYSKDLSKRTPPTGNEGARKVSSSVAVGISPKLTPAFPAYNGRK